jgi:hypothetical protein
VEEFPDLFLAQMRGGCDDMTRSFMS